MDTQTADDIPVRDTHDDLARTQSSKSVSTTSSGDDPEKRHSVYSSTHSFDSNNSKDDPDGKFLTTGSAGSRDYVHLQSASSDSELMMRDENKKKVKKSKSFLQKHGDKIKSKLSFRKKSKPKMEAKTGTF